MASGITFARHLAQLVRSFGVATPDVEEQKLNLRAALAAVRGAPVQLTIDRQTLFADREAVSPIFTGVRDLVARCERHGVVAFEADADTLPGDLLVLARGLAAEPAQPGWLESMLRAEFIRSVAVGFRRDPVPVLPPEALPAEPPAVATASEASASEAPSGAGPAEPAAADVPLPEPPVEPAPEPVPEPTVESVLPIERNSLALFEALAGARTAREAVPGLLAALAKPAEGPVDFARILNELCTFVEVSQREGRPADVLHVYHRLVEAEGPLDDPESRRAMIIAIRRLARPAILDVIAKAAAAETPPEPRALAVLARVGDEGVEAVVERAARATTTTDRDALAYLLRRLPNVGAALGAVTQRARPATARQGARLAAELMVEDAEPGLLDAAASREPPIRREALRALQLLHSARAGEAHVRALHDGDVAVRLQAAAGIAMLAPEGAADILAAALANEAEPEVQVAIVQAAGRLGTPEAVELLRTAAEPARGIFKRKPQALRVAAVHALAQLRLPGVSTALQALSQDKDAAVRDALLQATRIYGKRTTQKLMAVQE